MALTPKQEDALIRLHFSGNLLPTRKGYVYKDDCTRADMRSISALFRRGLATTPGGSYFPGRGGVVATNIHITEAGDKLAERLLTEDSRLPSYRRRW